MGLANCKECGKLFMQNAAGVCMDCYQLEEESEAKVAHYLRDHRNASITEVHEATQVPEKIILRMLKKGRITGVTQISHSCADCGKSITEGRVCQECGRKSILDQIKPEVKPVAQPATARRSGEGMHTTFNKR